MLKAAPVVLLFCLPIALLVGCAESKVDHDHVREPAAKLVKTEAVRQEALHRIVEVVGTLAAEDEVTVSSQAEGIVRRVVADLGDPVKSGQTLVEIDREKLQYTLDERRAAHARALTKYGASESGQLPPVEETADVRKAAAELAQAKQGRQRAGELHKRTLISQETLEDAETTLRLKTAAYDSALQNARNMRADVDASAAGMKLADRQLRDASIRAPFDGYVQKRMVSVGELVKDQMPVMTVVRVDPLKLMAEIPERMAPWIKVGQSLDLRVDAFPAATFAATVSRISPAVNTQTRTFAFEASAPNHDARLKPGTFARVHLETALVEQVLTVPYAAMQYRYGVYRVFTADGDHLTAHELKTGDRVGDRMEILGGVKLGELVALTDVDNLADGMKVTIHGDTE
jgi:membrane fusion protein (multidrug efflux system)